MILILIQLLFVASEPQTWGPAPPEPEHIKAPSDREIAAGAKGVPQLQTVNTQAIRF